jgi:hypothetical protein
MEKLLEVVLEIGVEFDLNGSIVSTLGLEVGSQVTINLLLEWFFDIHER